MNRIFILVAVAAAGILLWMFQARKIDVLEKEIRELAEPSARLLDPPRPQRIIRPDKAAKRIPAPEQRERPQEDLSPPAETSLASHLAGALADRMHLDAGQLAHVLPLLERHIEIRRAAIAGLLDAGDNLFSPFANQLGFQKAARALNALSTEDIDPLLDEHSRELLRAEEASQRENAVMILADSDYDAWKDLLKFPGVEQEAYDVFYDLAAFRLNHPLPDGFTREQLAARLADERSFITESLGPILSEDKARSLREALEVLASGPEISEP